MSSRNTSRVRKVYSCAYCGELMRGATQRDYHERTHKRLRDELPLKISDQSADNDSIEPPSLW